MKKIIITATGIAVVLLGGLVLFAQGTPGENQTQTTAEKVYVALEGEGAVAVLDAKRQALIKKIPLADEHTGTGYMPHNVEVSPDGDTVWVTGNAMADMSHQGLRLINTAHASEGHEDTESESDQLIAIDPVTDTIVRRMPLGVGQHLAHVVEARASGKVFVAAQETDTLYVLDARTLTQERSIALPQGSGPHGMRLSPDGATLYVAFMGGQALGVVDTKSGALERVPLDGAAVQTAVTPDGSHVAVSVYDTRSVGIYDIASKSLSYVRLPEGSEGPVQLYPAPDSQAIYVADQGVLGGRSASNKVYRIDLASQAVTTMEAGKAPHGITLSKDGSRAFVTNLKGDSVSILDTATGQKLREIPVGQEPNGISFWSGTESAAKGMMEGAQVTVYKSPTCGCCGNYIAELKRQGATVLVEEMSDAELAAKKQGLGVSLDLSSCHTAVMDGYVIEGHVPMEALAELRGQKPPIKGIALPGMPSGSPGMAGPKSAPFAVQTLSGTLFGHY